jgi:copper transporter 1
VLVLNLQRRIRRITIDFSGNLLKMRYFILLALLFAVATRSQGQELSLCLQDPSKVECVNVVYPPSQSASDVAKLCDSMDFMSGCTIQRQCASRGLQQGEYCESWSVLQDICLIDTNMSRMKECTGYNQLCGNAQYANRTSVVKQCVSSPRALPGLPTTDTTAKQVRSICAEMSMSGCEKCAGTGDYPNCDLLLVYSDLCIQMPGMSQCSDWKQMCAAIPTSRLCLQGGSEAPPTMRMYFHLGISDYILFESWVPRSLGGFIGSCIAVFLFGVVLEGMDVLGLYLERQWAQKERERLLKQPEKLSKRSQDAASEDSVGSSMEQLGHTFAFLPLMGNGYTPAGLSIDIQRFFFTFLIRSWGYLVMLITMVFNVWLFLAVVAGLSFGSVLFWRLRVVALGGLRTARSKATEGECVQVGYTTMQANTVAAASSGAGDEGVVHALADVARFGGSSHRCCS